MSRSKYGGQTRMSSRKRRPVDPLHQATGQERRLQAACERELGKLLAFGLIVDWEHRPDRAPGRGERGGRPDLTIGVGPGVVIAVELKTATGVVTPRQAAWLVCWGERGCVCRSLGEFLSFVGRWAG